MNIRKIIVFTMLATCLPLWLTTQGCQCSYNNPVVGSASALHDQVWKGFESSGLSQLKEKDDLFNGETLKVTSGGEAQLDFSNQMIIHLYNDSTTNLISANADPSVPLDVRMRLLEGGMIGIVKSSNGGQAVFETPNGGVIYVSGTQFYLFYQPDDQVVLAANFDGSVVLQVQSGPMQKIAPGKFAVFKPGMDIQERDLPNGASFRSLMKQFSSGNMQEITESWIDQALQTNQLPGKIDIRLVSIDPESLVIGDCPNKTDSTIITAEVFSDLAIKDVWIEWEINGNYQTAYMMQFQTGLFQAQLGPVDQYGTINLVIYATNEYGTQTMLGPITIQVNICIG